MAGQSYSFLQLSVKVFKVLAWVALALQVATGLILLVTGGPGVPVGGVDIPARLVGVLNVFAALIYFFLFMFISNVTRLLLEVHAQLSGGASAARS